MLFHQECHTVDTLSHVDVMNTLLYNKSSTGRLSELR